MPLWGQPDHTTRQERNQRCNPVKRRVEPCLFSALPEDVLVMEIFSYLGVEEIICLRRVNVYLYDVTHRAYIWKNFYERMKLPAPALLPSTSFTGPDNEHKYERMVTRAITLDDNWRSAVPKVYNSRLFDLSYNVHEVKVVKGGKYMVAVMSDAYRYFIGVLNLDADNLPDKSPLLARAPTLTKAFNLQAKFMHYKKIHKDPQRHTETTLDIPGLMIMYTTRVPIPPKNDSPMPNGIPPDGPSFDTFSEDDTHQVSRLSGETVDPLRNVNHQCSCLHISTATLESRASYTGPPIVLDRRRDFAFHDVDTVRCSNPLVETSLFSKDGIPYAAALQRPGNAIVFTNLNNREHGSIICNAHTAFPGSFHRIQTFRVLPEQNEILVIRRISRPVDPDWVPAYEGQRREYLIEGHVIELYEIPTIVPGMFLNVSSIDDVGPLSSLADSFDFPDTWDHVSTQGTPSTEAQGNPAPPPALSLFMRTKDFTEKKKKPRMELWNIFPTRKPTRDGTSYCWRYDLRGSVVQQSSREGDHDLKMTMHPGIDRSLLVETYDMNIFKSAAPKVRALRRYAHPSMLIPTNYEEPLRSPDVQEEILSKGRYRRPSHKYCTIPLPVDVQYKLGELGTLSVSWEETVGRACLVYGEDNRGRSRTIQILDFASDSNRGLVRMHAET